MRIAIGELVMDVRHAVLCSGQVRGQVQDLIAAIDAFIDGWNDRCHPFTWTKTADEILSRCRPGKGAPFTQH